MGIIHALDDEGTLTVCGLGAPATARAVMPVTCPQCLEVLKSVQRRGALVKEPQMVPTIHLNGTSRAALVEQLTSAARAVGKAIDALNEAAPNGRDYYPQGPDAFNRADEQHISRMVRLQAVRAELMAIFDALDTYPAG